MRQQIVIWTSPNGSEIRLTAKQQERLVAAGTWPCDAQGDEYRHSSRLAFGQPTLTAKEVELLIKHRKAVAR